MRLQPDQNHTPSVHIDFPGHPSRATIAEAWSACGVSVAPLTWEEFFEKFEQDGLAFLYQERTCTGMPSRRFRIVSRQRLG
jgi:anthranilate phosphoribosyltransferase